MKPGPIESRKREQLRFWLTGRWSDKVVAERLYMHADQLLADRLNALNWRRAV